MNSYDPSKKLNFSQERTMSLGLGKGRSSLKTAFNPIMNVRSEPRTHITNAMDR